MEVTQEGQMAQCKEGRTKSGDRDTPPIVPDRQKMDFSKHFYSDVVSTSATDKNGSKFNDAWDDQSPDTQRSRTSAIQQTPPITSPSSTTSPSNKLPLPTSGHSQGLVSYPMYSPGCHLLCQYTYPNSTLSPHLTRHPLPKYPLGTNGHQPLGSSAMLNNRNNLSLFGKTSPGCGGFIVGNYLSDTTMSRTELPPEERQKYHISEQPKGIPIPAPTKAYSHMAPGVGLKEMPLTPPSTSGASINSADVCSKPFGHPPNLKVHLKVHSGERPFSCHICSKTFTQRAYLQKHYIVHTGEKPHQCQVCHKCFAHSGNLKTHLRLHTGERPYHCKLCSAKFTRLTHLKLHGRVHNTEHPHKCHLCYKSYNHPCSLKRHLKGHRRVAPDTEQSREDGPKVDDEINMSERAERLDKAAPVTEKKVVTEQLPMPGLDKDHKEDQFRAEYHKNNGGNHPPSDFHDRAKTSNHGPATLGPIRVKQEASL